MTRSSVTVFGLLLFAVGCGEGDREPLPPVDCSVLDRYEFLNISDFTAGSYFYQYGDPTPGASPGVQPVGDVPVSDLEPPGRCNDTRFVKFAVSGHNFWGAGFGDWAHNDAASRANGTGYEGLSFWARSPRNFEKTFLFGVDDARTMIDPPDAPDGGGLPPATTADQDLDGDGFIGPGDIAHGTECRLPPSTEVGNADCYNGGVDAPPSGGARVPLANECGNQFHTWITTTETWQLVRIPWDELVQWPCPNRLQGGINRADIAKFEIKIKQGMQYEIWLDNIAFYRRR